MALISRCGAAICLSFVSPEVEWSGGERRSHCGWRFGAHLRRVYVQGEGGPSNQQHFFVRFSSMEVLQHQSEVDIAQRKQPSL